MANYKDRQYSVMAHYSNWAVQQIHTSETGCTTSASDRVCELQDRYDAIEISYLLNGWGFPKFTIPEDASDWLLSYKARRAIDCHPFDRDCNNLSEISKKRLELFAKANVERFKHIVSLIANPCIRRDLKQLWLLSHDCFTGKIDKDVFDIESDKLIRNISSVS